MDGPNKRKRKRILYTSSIESESHQPVETIAQAFLPQSLQTAVEESTVPEGGSPSTLPPSVMDAPEDPDSRYQIIQPLIGSMSEILRFEDAIDVMTSVLVSAMKTRIQAGKFGFEQINIGTTTNIADIRKYIE
jgi:hypothetical protein